MIKTAFCVLVMWLFKPYFQRRAALEYAVRMDALAVAAYNGGNYKVAATAIKEGNKALDSIERGFK